MDVMKFCKLIPKIELHAHLNGSLSFETLSKLFQLKSQDDPKSLILASLNLDKFRIENGDSQSLSQCFEVFRVAQALTDTPKAVELATLLTLEEFAADNVIYLELRSTPRKNENMTKLEYIQAMVDAVLKSPSHTNIKTGIIVSIDRRNPIEQAKDTVDAAIEMNKKYPNIVLGLDLSGDPSVGDFNDFADILLEGRKAGLKITIHTAEIANDVETKNILDWNPDRIGHATCIPESLWDQLYKSKIPVEICLTSNVKCEVVDSYDQHHFKKLYEAKYPLCISTDDKGVFTTTLSEEYVICAKTFKLSKEDIFNMALNACDYIFGSEVIKQELRHDYETWSKKYETDV